MLSPNTGAPTNLVSGKAYRHASNDNPRFREQFVTAAELDNIAALLIATAFRQDARRIEAGVSVVFIGHPAPSSLHCNCFGLLRFLIPLTSVCHRSLSSGSQPLKQHDHCQIQHDHHRRGDAEAEVETQLPLQEKRQQQEERQ